MGVSPSIIARMILASFLAMFGCSCIAGREREATPTMQLETPNATSETKLIPPDLTAFTLTPSPNTSLTPTKSPRSTELPTSTPTPAIITADKLTLLTIIYTLEHPEGVTGVAFSTDNTILATSSVDGIVRLWQVKNGALLFELEGHSDIVRSLAFSPDGKVLASGSDDSTVRLWQVEDGSLMKILDTSIVGRAVKVEFSPDGSLIAVGGDMCYIILRSPSTGLLRRTLRQPGCQVKNRGAVEFWGLVFSSEDSSLISAEGQLGGSGGSIQRWDYEQYTPPEMLRGFDIVLRDMSLSPDGSTLALAQVGSSEIWELSTMDGSLIKKYEGHEFRVNAVQYSPDGQLLISGGRDEMIRLWDPDTGETLHTLEAHTETVNSLVFSSDGSYIASASDDGIVILWGLRSP